MSCMSITHGFMACHLFPEAFPGRSFAPAFRCFSDIRWLPLGNACLNRQEDADRRQERPVRMCWKWQSVGSPQPTNGMILSPQISSQSLNHLVWYLGCLKKGGFFLWMGGWYFWLSKLLRFKAEGGPDVEAAVWHVKMKTIRCIDTGFVLKLG